MATRSGTTRKRAAAKLPTFEVSKEGLRKQLARRPPGFAIAELVSNAWDEDATHVDVTLVPEPGHEGFCRLTVEDDDPNGFTDLSHAYTLFAESEKKGDPGLRGRFNLGEKLVIALCESAVIETTTGTVSFDEGGRVMGPAVRERGSRFDGLLRMDAAEYADAIQVFRTLIPPQGVETTLNGTPLVGREPVRTFSQLLPTEIADADGNLRPTDRKAEVRLYEALAGERPHIYELGIPVVELIDGGDEWHIDVGQKVPLSTDRTDVKPFFLRELRVAVANHMADELDRESASKPWVMAALADKRIEAGAVRTIIDVRFGENAVAADPSDREGENIAKATGHTVVPGGTFSKDAWRNIRKAEALPPAGQVTPSPAKMLNEQDWGGIQPLERERWTPGIERADGLTRQIAAAVGVDLRGVTFNVNARVPAQAMWGAGVLTFNVGRLGYDWFDGEPSEVVALILHELGHAFVSDHLSADYADMVAALGARLALALAVADADEWHLLVDMVNA